MSRGSSSCGSCTTLMPSSGSKWKFLSSWWLWGLPGAVDLWPLWDWTCSAVGTTGEKDSVALVLLRARRNDEVEEELTREARRGQGEGDGLLGRWSPERGRTGRVKKLMIQRGHNIFTFSWQIHFFVWDYPLLHLLCLSRGWCLAGEGCSLSCWARCWT